MILKPFAQTPYEQFQSISIFGLVLLFQFSLHAESNIIINEIHYDVSDKTLRSEFIELIMLRTN